MNRTDIVENEIKPLFNSFATELYGTPELAEEGWNRITQAMAVQQAKQRRQDQAEAAARKAERDLRTKRGTTTPVPTCTRCFSQHRGEC